MNSDKFVTIGITATKDVQKAFKMLLEEESATKSYKALFERMLFALVSSRTDMFKKQMNQAETDLKIISEDIARVKEELANETDSERSKWLASKLETYREMEKQFLENRESNQMLFERYQRIWDAANPSKAYPDEINDKDVMFRD